MPLDFLDVLGKVGSGCGLLALPYLIFQNLRSRPWINFDFRGGSGEHIQKDGLHQFRHSTHGVLKNRSLDPNAITRIHLAAWANESKTSYLRFGGNVSVFEAHSKKELSMPLQLAPREAKSIEIVFEFPVQGTSDEKLLSEHVPVVPGSSVLRQKHEYELCFEDINDNFFDASGRKINSEEASLRWALPNTTQQLQNGHVWQFLAHYVRILRAKIKFKIRMVGQALGLWR